MCLNTGVQGNNYHSESSTWDLDSHHHLGSWKIAKYLYIYIRMYCYLNENENVIDLEFRDSIPPTSILRESNPS